MASTDTTELTSAEIVAYLDKRCESIMTLICSGTLSARELMRCNYTYQTLKTVISDITTEQDTVRRYYSK